MANLEKRVLGDLECQIITTESPPLLTVVLCHGFGAPGDDLVPVGAQLLQVFPELLDKIQFVFPAAPLSLDDFGIPGGRAWWPLDMERLSRAAQSGQIEALRQEVPAQLPQAREKLSGLLEVLELDEPGEESHFVLGGFSQGAMLATDVALHLATPPRGLIVWSGALINEQDWAGHVSQLCDVPVIQSHGREDPILPYEAALALRTLLEGARAHLNFIGFRGPHTIPKEAVTATGQLLERLAGIIE